MSMRVSGLISGMDTENLVKQLTAKYSSKKDKVWKTKETLKIKQDIWKDLNKEISSFFSNTLSNSRFSSSYVQNEISLSESKVASVIGKKFDGIQTLEVKQLATNTYMTGGKVEKSYPIGIDSKIDVTIGGSKKEISITSDMSMDQVAQKLSEVGLSANFDEKNGRLFLASKSAGLNSNFSIDADGATLSALGLGTAAIKTVGQDAIVTLNGTEFTSDSNNFEINGLNITASAVGTTTLSMKDSSKIFETVKDFIDKYNELAKKISSLYEAKKDGYQPLTDDEKYSMSDRQIEEWEKKVKESILSKDETLGSLNNILKNDMMQSYDINGKKMSLYSLGIATGNYFSTAKEDRGTYQIDEEKLKAKIAEDPSSVVSFMGKLSAKLYDDLSKKMKSSQYNSYNTIYPDKQYKKDLINYDEEITRMEKELAEREDKYYRQFAKMEALLSKMQNQGNALAGFFGIN